MGDDIESAIIAKNKYLKIFPVFELFWPSITLVIVK